SGDRGALEIPDRREHFAGEKLHPVADLPQGHVAHLRANDEHAGVRFLLLLDDLARQRLGVAEKIMTALDLGHAPAGAALWATPCFLPAVGLEGVPSALELAQIAVLEHRRVGVLVLLA